MLNKNGTIMALNYAGWIIWPHDGMSLLIMLHRERLLAVLTEVGLLHLPLWSQQAIITFQVLVSVVPACPRSILPG